MVWGLEFTDPEVAGRVCKQAFSNGLMVETSGAKDQVVKLLPPLTISHSDLSLGLNILSDSLHTVLESTVSPPVFYAPSVAGLDLGIHFGSFASF